MQNTYEKYSVHLGFNNLLKMRQGKDPVLDPMLEK